MRTQEAIGQSFVFAQEPKQEMFRLDIGRPELAGFIPRKENDAPCFLRVTLKHISPRTSTETEGSPPRAPAPHTTLIRLPLSYIIGSLPASRYISLITKGTSHRLSQFLW